MFSQQISTAVFPCRLLSLDKSLFSVHPKFEMLQPVMERQRLMLVPYCCKLLCRSPCLEWLSLSFNVNDKTRFKEMECMGRVPSTENSLYSLFYTEIDEKSGGERVARG